MTADEWRRCLRANKIFFDTAAAVMLSFTAIVVTAFYGCRQDKVAQKQLEAADLQAKVALSQISPHFDFETERVGDYRMFVVKAEADRVNSLRVRCSGYLTGEINGRRTNVSVPVMFMGPRDWIDDLGDNGDAYVILSLKDSTYHWSRFEFHDIADLRGLAQGYEDAKESREDRRSRLSIYHGPWEAKVLTEIEYVDAIGMKRSVLFTSDTEGEDVEQISQAPSFMFTIDGEAFQNADGTPNSPAIREELKEIETRVPPLPLSEQ